ncbi:MAG TPA: hypothetical protein PKV71_13805 [Calditrichia bacterium]|nr:hypothetical protein [Calditrichia bacterium]
MNNVSVNIHGIRLNAPANWLFAPGEHGILARRETRGGVFRMICQPNGPLNGNGEAGYWEKAVAIFNMPAVKEPFQQKRPMSGTRQLHGVSYGFEAKGSVFMGRLWYLSEPESPLYAAYVCNWSRRDESLIREEVVECERMMLSARLPQ